MDIFKLMNNYYVMRISSKDVYDLVGANTIDELLEEISKLGCDTETERDNIIDWLNHAYPTCKLFLSDYSVEWTQLSSTYEKVKKQS